MTQPKRRRKKKGPPIQENLVSLAQNRRAPARNRPVTPPPKRKIGSVLDDEPLSEDSPPRQIPNLDSDLDSSDSDSEVFEERPRKMARSEKAGAPGKAISTRRVRSRTPSSPVKGTSARGAASQAPARASSRIKARREKDLVKNYAPASDEADDMGCDFDIPLAAQNKAKSRLRKQSKRDPQGASSKRKSPHSKSSSKHTRSASESEGDSSDDDDDVCGTQDSNTSAPIKLSIKPIQTKKRRGPSETKLAEFAYERKLLSDDERSYARMAFYDLYPCPPSNMRAQSRYEQKYKRPMSQKMIDALWKYELQPWSERWHKLYHDFVEVVREKKKQKRPDRDPSLKQAEVAAWCKVFHEKHGDAKPKPIELKPKAKREKSAASTSADAGRSDQEVPSSLAPTDAVDSEEKPPVRRSQRNAKSSKLSLVKTFPSDKSSRPVESDRSPEDDSPGLNSIEQRTSAPKKSFSKGGGSSKAAGRPMEDVMDTLDDAKTVSMKPKSRRSPRIAKSRLVDDQQISVSLKPRSHAKTTEGIAKNLSMAELSEITPALVSKSNVPTLKHTKSGSPRIEQHGKKSGNPKLRSLKRKDSLLAVPVSEAGIVLASRRTQESTGEIVLQDGVAKHAPVTKIGSDVIHAEQEEDDTLLSKLEDARNHSVMHANSTKSTLVPESEGQHLGDSKMADEGAGKNTKVETKDETVKSPMMSAVKGAVKVARPVAAASSKPSVSNMQHRLLAVPVSDAGAVLSLVRSKEHGIGHRSTIPSTVEGQRAKLESETLGKSGHVSVPSNSLDNESTKDKSSSSHSPTSNEHKGAHGSLRTVPVPNTSKEPSTVMFPAAKDKPCAPSMPGSEVLSGQDSKLFGESSLPIISSEKSANSATHEVSEAAAVLQEDPLSFGN